MSEFGAVAPRPGLSVGYVPGVTLTKWRTLWGERFRVPLAVVEIADADQLTALHSGAVDLCFVRLPIDRDGLHAIPLYEEVMVAWVEKEHPIAAFDEVTLADLADETVLTTLDPIAIDRVLAGAVLLVPMSIARSASRRDLVHRSVVDADPSPIALAWLTANDNPLIEEFIGVVRGRTPNSARTSRERTARATQQPKPGVAQPRRPRRR